MLVSVYDLIDLRCFIQKWAVSVCAPYGSLNSLIISPSVKRMNYRASIMSLSDLLKNNK